MHGTKAIRKKGKKGKKGKGWYNNNNVKEANTSECRT